MPVAPRADVFIDFIHIDASVEHKIRNRRGGGCTGGEVQEAFRGRSDANLRWEHDPNHGLRVVGVGRTFAERLLFAAFAPIHESDGTWALKTARPI